MHVQDHGPCQEYTPESDSSKFCKVLDAFWLCKSAHVIKPQRLHKVVQSQCNCKAIPTPPHELVSLTIPRTDTWYRVLQFPCEQRKAGRVSWIPLSDAVKDLVVMRHSILINRSLLRLYPVPFCRQTKQLSCTEWRFPEHSRHIVLVPDLHCLRPLQGCLVAANFALYMQAKALYESLSLDDAVTWHMALLAASVLV